VLGLPQQLLRMMAELDIGPLQVLGLVVLVYIVLGMVFDGLSMMIMTLPIMFPLLVGLGYDPVWLGVIITLLIEIGMLTPPVGMNIFVVIGMTNGEVKLGEGAMAALPYWLVLLSLIAVLTAFPELVLWLPGLVGI
jgi:TRAP-type C4-dicarboxylate transport system permease large subunit